MNLTNKVAIVTGGSRGLGRQIALELGRQGAKVVIAARTVEPRRTLPGTIGETVELIKQAGGDALAVKCDVANPDDLRLLVEQTVAAFGGIDVVVNNAADMVGQELEPMVEAMLGLADVAAADTTSADDRLDSWLRQFAINVHAPFLLMVLATPYLRRDGGGVIVNISSEAAEIVPPPSAGVVDAQRSADNLSLGYATTKAALNRLTNKAASELAADKIAIVAVSPGPIRTELADLMAGRGFINTTEYASMGDLVSTVLNVITAEDPMTFSGQILTMATA
ncbi:SDR family NAD(P)-dependent oxidoreductase [Jatrophihabitans sp. DSM 45814]